MAELKKTTQGGRKDPHYHIAHMTDDGTGMMSAHKDGHTHDMLYVPPMPAMMTPGMDGMGNMMQDATPGGWQIMESNGHTHSGLEDYQPVIPTDKRTDKEKVEHVLRLYDEAGKIEKVSRKKGYESEDMYSHKQWDQSQKDSLEAVDRAAITINQVESKIDSLTGYQRQNRTEIKYLPVEGGDARVAEMLNALVKNITEQCQYQREKSKTFDDTAIVGRGLFNVSEDFTHDIQGKIVIEKFEWDEARLGPHTKEDLADCNFIIKEKWHSESELKGLYPDEWDEFSPEVRLKESGSLVSEDWDKRLRSDDFVDLVAKKYKVLECIEKEFNRSYILANSSDGSTFDVEGWSKADIASAKSIPGFVKIPRVTYKLHSYKICTFILLDDEVMDEQDFPLVPVYAKFRKGAFWGKVEGVKDLQHLLNKAYSQFVDIINKVANYGWFYDDTTFASNADKDKWLKNASSPGFNQKIADVNRPPAKIEGVKFPAELVNAISMFGQSIREIMNVNLEMMGADGQARSGIAMQQKIVQQLMGNDYLFDNMAFAEKIIGRMIIRKVQKLYTPERIYRILSNQNTAEGFKVGEQDFSAYSKEEIIAMLRNTDLSKHDVIVSESANSPSAMMGNFMMLLELAGKGIPIPPEAIMEFAPIPNKNRVLELIKQQQARTQAMENKKYDTEIDKTLITQQGKFQESGTQSAPQ